MAKGRGDALLVQNVAGGDDVLLELFDVHGENSPLSVCAKWLMLRKGKSLRRVEQLVTLEMKAQKNPARRFRPSRLACDRDLSQEINLTARWRRSSKVRMSLPLESAHRQITRSGYGGDHRDLQGRGIRSATTV